MSETTVAIGQAADAGAPSDVSDGDVIAVVLALAVGTMLAWQWAGRWAVGRGWRSGARLAAQIMIANLGLAIGAFSGALLAAFGVPPGVNAAGSGLVLLLCYRRPTTPSLTGYATVGAHALLGSTVVAVAAIGAVATRCMRWVSSSAKAPRQVEGQTYCAADDGAESGLDLSRDSLLASDAPAADDVQFSYLDAGGAVTERRVQVTWRGTYSFEGFCHLRAEERTFRYDRIVGDVVDLDTGEVLSVEHWRP